MDGTWMAAGDELRLDADEVHVWRASLDRDAGEVERLRAVLAPDEQARAERFLFPDVRSRFVVARALLRMILARYAKAEPGELRFDYGPHGKPSLAAPWAREQVRFNMSDSHGMGLYAVARGRELGADIERVRDNISYERLALRCFSEAEFRSFRAAPPELRREAFFNGWTRKEAYIKAIGLGLSFPLKSFTVRLTPNEPAALLWVKDGADEPERWTMRALHPADGWAAAVAVEGSGWSLRQLEWR